MKLLGKYGFKFASTVGINNRYGNGQIVWAVLYSYEESAK